MKKDYNLETIVFIDDAGDPGFKFDKGSSNFFIVSAVIFDDPLEAENTSVAIKEIRRKLGFPENNFEFHFCKSNKNVKKEFLEKIKDFNFKIRYLIIDKRIIRSDELKNNKNSFYSYAIKLLLSNSSGSIINSQIRIDGSGDREFRRSFYSYLRKNLNSKEEKIIKNLKLVDSKENTLIQLADMVVGSEFRYFEHQGSKNDFDMYRNIIKKRIEDEWIFR